MEGLEVGTCIDYKPDANSPWEIAIIEQVTEFKTEFKISLASGKLPLTAMLEPNH